MDIFFVDAGCLILVLVSLGNPLSLSKFSEIDPTQKALL